eukprot:3322821-Rhodomonas_salina.2
MSGWTSSSILGCLSPHFHLEMRLRMAFCRAEVRAASSAQVLVAGPPTLKWWEQMAGKRPTQPAPASCTPSASLLLQSVQM